NGDAHERGDAGAVDLRNAVEIDHDLAAAIAHERLQRFVKLLGGFADGEASADFQQINAILLPDGNLHGYVLGHLRTLRALWRESGREAQLDPLGLYDRQPILDNLCIKILNCGYENL